MFFLTPYSKSQMQSLTPLMITKLNASQTQQLVLNLLTPQQLNSLSLYQISMLTNQQVNGSTGFTADQLNSLGDKAAYLSLDTFMSMSNQLFSHLAPAAIANLNAIQIMLLSPTKLSAMTDAQLLALTPKELHVLSTYQVDGVSRAVSANDNGLTTHAITLLGDKVSNLSANVIANMDTSQISAISVSALNLFSPDQIKAYILASPAINIATNQSSTITDSYHFINGSTGQESVVLSKTSTHDIINGNVENITIQNGNFSAYTFKGSNGVLQIFDSKGVELYDIQVNTAGTNINFADGSAYLATLNQTGGIALTTKTILPPSPPVTPPITATTHLTENITMGSGFGSVATQLKADITHAINNVFEYINSSATMNIQVNAISQQSNLLADCYSPLYQMKDPDNSSATLTSTADYLLDTGKHFNSTPDAVIEINMANIGLSNLNYNVAPTSNQLDFVSIIEHEVMHALGFNGAMGLGYGKSAFDTLVSMQNNQPFFTGTNSELVNGGKPVALAYGIGQGSDYYHINNSTDLMNAYSQQGHSTPLSALDLAILKDVGVPLIGTVNLLHFSPVLVA